MMVTGSSILGEKVVNTNGEKLGNIKDIMIDTSSGRVTYAVLSFGGFLGMIEKLFAIPLESFQLSPKRDCFVLDISEEKLETVEEFDKENWPRQPQPEFLNIRGGFFRNVESGPCKENINQF